MPTSAHLTIRRVLLSSLIGVSPFAMAADPDKAAASPTLSLPPYESALNGFQPFADQTPDSWIQANTEVAEIGGWRAYAKESYRSRKAESEAMAKPQMPEISIQEGNNAK